MFGSNFFGNFGIPDPSFGYQGADAQGGYLSTNAPVPGQDPSQSAAPAAPIGSPAGGLPSAPQQPTPAAPSPLAGGPLAPGGAQPQTQPTTPEAGVAPAAGIGSPFGKAPNG
jgi:hypothetical protein